MSGFSAEWLALREPFDAAARPAQLAHELRTHLARGAHAAPLSVVDLGAGSGSNLRYLAPLLGGAQQWRLIDNDGALLDAAVAATHVWAETRGARVEQRGDILHVRAAAFSCSVRREQRDLVDAVALELPAGGVVTAAALLDLVSAAWLESLASRCAAARVHVLFSLSYDGRTTCTPIEPEDALVLELFNRHQRGDKGFGPALGPTAASGAAAAFAAHGYSVTTAQSDWVIGAGERAMQLALLDGWRAAALEMAPERKAALAAWHTHRCAHVDAGRSTLRVGHVDLLGRL